MTIHKLKCHSEFFDAVVSGSKSFEIRKNDRGYEVGDDLHLVRTDKAGKPTHPGQDVVKRVHYLLEGGQFGILHGFVVLGLERPRSLDDFTDDEIEAEAQKRFGLPDEPIERVYSLLAEGEINAAMDEMSRAFDLPSPGLAKRIAGRIARGRQMELTL